MTQASDDDRNAPLERRLNLAFALLNTRDGAGWRSAYEGPWLREKIRGYRMGMDADVARKVFQRDIQLLKEAGFPVRVMEGPDGEPVYCARYEDEALPPIDFTPEEARVLGIAGDLGRVGKLGSFTRSGWMKLAASGVERDFADSTPQVTHTTNDLVQADPQTISAVLDAIRDDHRIAFDYAPHRGAAPQRRSFDPWGLVPRRSKLFLVGFDADRGEERSFRIFRVSRVTPEGPRETEPGDADLGYVVDRCLATDRSVVSAVVQLAPGRAMSLRQAAQSVAEDEARLVDVDRDWLVRTCASYGPDAVVLEPPELRADVLALLEEVAR